MTPGLELRGEPAVDDDDATAAQRGLEGTGARGVVHVGRRRDGGRTTDEGNR